MTFDLEPADYTFMQFLMVKGNKYFYFSDTNGYIYSYFRNGTFKTKV